MRLPQNPFHPGEMLLEEFLVPGKMTQAALAKKLSWTRARLNELIKGKRDITADSALISCVFWGRPPSLDEPPCDVRENREEVIVAGAIIIRRVMEVLGLESWGDRFILQNIVEGLSLV